ncbi:MAG: tetratricopeptide repeat protein [Acetobacteraceae bacterium]|nr:tetratricopeptide repeat protein [Acetobacteraceae bacterium]
MTGLQWYTMKPQMALIVGGGILLLVGLGVLWNWSETATGLDAAVERFEPNLPIPPLPPRVADGAQYDRCLAQVPDDPRRAATDAQAWRAAGGGASSVHCLAMAELALGRGEQAARLLLTLAGEPATSAPLRAAMFSQASQAWQLAGRADDALEAAKAAVVQVSDNPDLWIDLANLAIARKDYAGAADDLSRALALDRSRADILVLRAGANRLRGRLDAALDDVDRAITADPDNAEALLERGVLRQRRDDPQGARRDWMRVMVLAPESQAADLATQDLALLDAGPVR